MKGSAAPLSDRHPRVLLDLDGVVYLLGDPIEGAAETLCDVRQRGGSAVFVTNNASRSAADVAELLVSVGVDAVCAEVCTSAQVAAAILRSRFAPESTVLVVGAAALRQEIAAAGLRPVSSPAESDDVQAVVQGYDRDVGWKQLAEAAVAIRSGALWVATNTDATLPSPRGPLPGNGSLVAAVVAGAGREPDVVAGKPSPDMLRHALAQGKTEAGETSGSPLLVGDRCDTDIAGAHAVGISSLLVLSGSTAPSEVLTASPMQRPCYLGWSITALREPHPAVHRTAEGAIQCRSWTVSVGADAIRLSGHGDALDALRAMAVAAWCWSDAGEEDQLPPTAAAGAEAAAALSTLGLSG